MRNDMTKELSEVGVQTDISILTSVEKSNILI